MESVMVFAHPTLTASSSQDKSCYDEWWPLGTNEKQTWLSHALKCHRGQRSEVRGQSQVCCWPWLEALASLFPHPHPTPLFFPWVTSPAINSVQPRGLYLKYAVGNTLCLVALNTQGHRLPNAASYWTAVFTAESFCALYKFLSVTSWRGHYQMGIWW